MSVGLASDSVEGVRVLSTRGWLRVARGRPSQRVDPQGARYITSTDADPSGRGRWCGDLTSALCGPINRGVQATHVG